MRIVIDIEANALVSPTKIWLIVCKDIDTGKYYKFRNVTDDVEEKGRFLQFSNTVDLWVGHNFLGYDYPNLNHLVGLDVVSISGVCIDTLVMSKLIDYSRVGHSIEAYGIEFGIPKGQNYGPGFFSKWSQELEDYCVRDVDICHKIYLKYLAIIDDTLWRPSITLEHEFQLIVNQLHDNGFSFNTSRATRLLEKVKGELDGLDKEIERAFPPRLRCLRTIFPKVTQHGTLHKGDFRWVKGGDLSEFNGGPFSRCTWESFNASSHKQVVDTLNLAGWHPTAKTQTYIDTERELNRLKYSKDPNKGVALTSLHAKLETLKNTGWKISEENLLTLPSKEQCLIKIQNDNELTLTNIIKTTLKRNGLPLSHTTIKIQELLETNSSKEITELLLKILSECLKNKKDVAEFVKNESSLWSITITKQGTFVDFSASYATDTLDGSKDIKTALKNIFYDAPAPARTLARRILLESRRRTLTEWLGLVHPDTQRVHGSFYGIGAWTHRMAHQRPNTANIPNDLDTQGKTKLYGKEMRSLWQAPKGRLLVGVDAEGIQLRIFAHYIDDEEFTNALVNGSKTDKTDPHSLNQRVLGDVCKSRSASKRFIYALLLGAGLWKLSQILECSDTQTKEALNRLLERYGGFQFLKQNVIPQDASRGYFEGLDGRKVRIPGSTLSERRHLAMSGYLQNGEAIIMKKATCRWHPKLKLKYPDIKLVNFVHDEWQTEVPNNMEIALDVAQVKADSLREVGEELKLKCPLAGSYWNDDHRDYTIGTNWSATH